MAASPAEIAWTSPCAATCRVQLLDLATGRRAAVELPKVQLASWHPGATRLAVAVIGPGQDQASLVVG